MRVFLVILFVLFLYLQIFELRSQIEYVPSVHPVYDFVIHQEAKGILPHFSTSELPWQRKEVVSALIVIRNSCDHLSNRELEVLEHFEMEFGITAKSNSVVFYSKTHNKQLFFDNLFSGDDKFLYLYDDSSTSVNIKPLGDIDFSVINDGTNNGYALMGNLGVRLFGTISNSVGYYLQSTNGKLISGDRWVALNDNKLRHNIKFAELKSDFDFTESHVSFTQDWFTAVIGRQTRFHGSGIFQKTYISDLAPPMDGITLAAKFINFNYTFSVFSLLSIPDSSIYDVGFATYLAPKFMSTHRFALRPQWGEIAFWEAVIYSERGLDLSYINPLSFLKSLEHANRDRDNSIMGLDWTIRPFGGFQINGTFLLDDIVFGEIGTGYWSNKWAFNLGVSHSSKIGYFGCEYARVEPYTFSHFNRLNAYTNDRLPIGSMLYPNSDMFSLIYRFYLLGNRYPWSLRLSHHRSGENIYDENGNLIYNVGSDLLQTRRPEDNYSVTFLDGRRKDANIIEFMMGYEIIRNFNLSFISIIRFEKGEQTFTNFRLKFSFEDF